MSGWPSLLTSRKSAPMPEIVLPFSAKATHGGGDLLEPLPAQVVEQQVRAVVVGHEDIDKAVAVVIRNGHAHAAAEVLRDSRLGRDVRERAVAVVAVERVRERLVVFRIAVGAQLAGQAYRVLVHFPLAVVRDEQIEQAVVVVVQPGRGGGPHLLAAQGRALHPGFVGDVGEGAVAIVVQQLVAGDVRHEEIGPAVVVVIAHGDAHPVALACHPGSVGDVGEGQVPVVVEEPVLVLVAFLLEGRDGRAVDEEDVGIAVVVVIEHGHARHHGLGLVLVRRGRALDGELHSGARGDLFEADRGGQRDSSQRDPGK